MSGKQGQSPESVVKGFGSVVATHVEVRGVCDSCAREETEESVPKNPEQPRGHERRKT